MLLLLLKRSGRNIMSEAEAKATATRRVMTAMKERARDISDNTRKIYSFDTIKFKIKE